MYAYSRFVRKNFTALSNLFNKSKNGRDFEDLFPAWIIERLDRKLMSRGLTSYRRLVGSCSSMALDGSIIVGIGHLH